MAAHYTCLAGSVKKKKKIKEKARQTEQQAQTLGASRWQGKTSTIQFTSADKYHECLIILKASRNKKKLFKCLKMLCLMTGLQK